MAPFLHQLFLHVKMPSSPCEVMETLGEYMLTKEFAGRYVNKVSVEAEVQTQVQAQVQVQTQVQVQAKAVVQTEAEVQTETFVAEALPKKMVEPAWISPRQSDTLFWCLYAIHYGYNDYLQVGRNYGIRLLEVKKEIGEWIQKNQSKMKQTNYKITKAAVQEIMSECLTSPRDTSPLSLLAYLAFFNLNIVIVNETETLAIKFIGDVDSENPTYLVKRDTYGKYKIREDALGVDEMAAMETSCFFLENHEKPLKTISHYKLDELEALAKKRGVYDMGKKYKKADLYAVVYEACKFSIQPVHTRVRNG